MNERPTGPGEITRDEQELTRLFGERAALSWDTDTELPPDIDDPAMRLLAALRADVSAGRPVDATVAPVIPLGARRRLRLRASRTAVAVGVAATVLSAGGVAAASITSSPGSPLYPIHKVLTGTPHKPATDPRVAEIARRIASARAAVRAGRLADAQATLDAVRGLVAALPAGSRAKAEAALQLALQDLAAAQTRADQQRRTASPEPTNPGSQHRPPSHQQQSGTTGGGQNGGRTGGTGTPGHHDRTGSTRQLSGLSGASTTPARDAR